MRLRALKTRNNMGNSNITTELCDFDTSFLTEYRENSDNYTEGRLNRD